MAAVFVVSWFFEKKVVFNNELLLVSYYATKTLDNTHFRQQIINLHGKTEKLARKKEGKRIREITGLFAVCRFGLTSLFHLSNYLFGLRQCFQVFVFVLCVANFRYQLSVQRWQEYNLQ